MSHLFTGEVKIIAQYPFARVKNYFLLKNILKKTRAVNFIKKVGGFRYAIKLFVPSITPQKRHKYEERFVTIEAPDFILHTSQVYAALAGLSATIL